MLDKALPAAARTSAANAMLDRGFGKAPQRVELDDKPKDMADNLRLFQPGDPDFEELDND